MGPTLSPYNRQQHGRARPIAPDVQSLLTCQRFEQVCDLDRSRAAVLALLLSSLRWPWIQARTKLTVELPWVGRILWYSFELRVSRKASAAGTETSRAIGGVGSASGREAAAN